MKKLKFGYENSLSSSLFFLCWIAYCSTYVCRLTFSAVMPELAGNHVFTESQIASVSSAFFVCYGVGQLLSGSLGDKIAPRIMIFLGILISAISNIFIFFFHNSYPALLLLWALNGAVQSMVWSPILRIAGDYFNDEEKIKFGIDVSTTVPVGTLASYGISLLTLSVLPWHFAFLTCGTVLLLAALYWYLGVKRLSPHLNRIKHNAKKEITKTPVLPFKDLIKMIVSSGILFILLSVAIQGTLKDSVTQWIPTFFSSQFHTGTNVSLILTMALPVTNVTSPYFAKLINRRFRNELTTSAIFFLIAGIFLTILLFFGTDNILLALICMAAVTNCMFAINVMIVTVLPLHFSKFGRVSTVAGFITAASYIGCGGLNFVAGVVLENTGSSWKTLFILWLVLSVSALVLTIICLFPWKRFVKKRGL